MGMFYQSSQMAANNWHSEIGVAKVLFALGHKDAAMRLYQEAFLNMDVGLQTSCLRDADLDALRAYLAVHARNRNLRE